ARLAEAEDERLRALADLDNLRKRCAAQVERAEADARTEVARQWLPVVDNLERALEHAAADPRTIVEGIQAVRQQALGVLASLGFPRRDDTGATFDPALHEAVAGTYDPRVPPGTIVQVVRPGYGEPDRQLRPAQVVGAKADRRRAGRGLLAVSSTRFWACRGPRPRTRSSRPTASWPASTIPTSTKIPEPRIGSRRSPRRTTCCPIRRPGAVTTPSARISGRCPRTWIPRRSGAAGPAREPRGAPAVAGSAQALAATWAASTSRTSSAGSSEAGPAGALARSRAPTRKPNSS